MHIKQLLFYYFVSYICIRILYSRDKKFKIMSNFDIGITSLWHNYWKKQDIYGKFYKIVLLKCYLALSLCSFLSHMDFDDDSFAVKDKIVDLNQFCFTAKREGIFSTCSWHMGIFQAFSKALFQKIGSQWCFPFPFHLF